MDNGILRFKEVQRFKRPADDAFGTGDTNSSGLLSRSFGLGSAAAGVDAAAAPQTENRLLAHMLGLDLPGVEPSASYLPAYEWFPRDQNRPQLETPDSSQPVSPSPGPGSGSGSNHSSPASAMPIPFSFDQTRNFWDAPLLQDLGVNFVSGGA